MLRKIRALPETTRKVIFWVLFLVVAVGLFFWWLRSIPEKVERVQESGLGIEFPTEEVQENINNLRESIPQFDGVEEQFQQPEEQ